jgi:multiple antibiotic resistance protein
MVLFAVIDITGSIPIILEIKQKTGEIAAFKVTIVAFLMMLFFLFIGEPFLGLFRVDLQSFAIAGSLILFFIALEMVMGIEIYKYDMSKTASIIPLSFPLIAGAGSLTTLISLKSEYTIYEILIGLSLNMVVVYFVIRATNLFERILGKSGILILKKIFGIILLAMAIRLFLSNSGIQLPRNAS